MNAEARVRNLIRRVDLSKAGPKKRAVIKLLQWKPLARRIRFAGKCHCRGQLLLSYRLEHLHSNRWTRDGWEECGYYCPSCGFGNAGAREVGQHRERVGR